MILGCFAVSIQGSVFLDISHLLAVKVTNQDSDIFLGRDPPVAKIEPQTKPGLTFYDILIVS